MKRKFDLGTMVEIGISVALAVILSYFKVFRMPQGGSVSLQMLPIIVLSVRRGAPSGILGGFLLGVIRMLLSSEVFHPVQGLLDYPVAFAVVGFAGIWVRYGKDKIDYIRNGLAIAFAFLLSFVTHVIAGKIFFGAYAPEGMGQWWYSITYNATYLVPELVVTFILTMLLMTRREIFEKKGTR